MKNYTKKIEYKNRIEYHNDDGQLHREDGPAVEWDDGTKSWYIEGKRHRTDGPALEWHNGYKEWFINDKRLTEKQFNQYLNSIFSIK